MQCTRVFLLPRSHGHCFAQFIKSLFVDLLRTFHLYVILTEVSFQADNLKRKPVLCTLPNDQLDSSVHISLSYTN